jgi:hypothetical protein
MKRIILLLLVPAIAALVMLYPSPTASPYTSAFGVAVAHADGDPDCPDDICVPVYNRHGQIVGSRCFQGEVDGGGCTAPTNWSGRSASFPVAHRRYP